VEDPSTEPADSTAEPKDTEPEPAEPETVESTDEPEPVEDPSTEPADSTAEPKDTEPEPAEPETGESTAEPEPVGEPATEPADSTAELKDTEPEPTEEEELEETPNNLHAPEAENFEVWIEKSNLETGEIIFTINGEDKDRDEIFYELRSGNPDLDQDGVPMFDLNASGILTILDSDEIFDSGGSILKLEISLSDKKGKESFIEGLIKVKPKLMLKSIAHGAGWYESSWLGLFLATPNNWIFQQKLGWIYISPTEVRGYWFWDSSLRDWMWTDETFFPWTFSNASSTWIYYSMEEKVRLFEHNLQKWRLR